jgi:hypothetical protein
LTFSFHATGGKRAWLAGFFLRCCEEVEAEEPLEEG